MSSVEPPNGVGVHEATADAGYPAGASGSAPAANGDGSASHASVAAVSSPAAPVPIPPPGYILVTLHLEGQERPALQHLPVEVLPSHTFMDVCAAAMARVPAVPAGHCLQAAFLESDGARLTLHEPHVLARAVLRAFAPGTCLEFHVGAPVALVTGKRLAKVVPRRQRTWPKALARAVIGVAKFVLAVEAAALLRGGAFSFLRRVRRGGADSTTGSDSGSDPEDGGAGRRRGGRRRDMGGETEAALEAVAAYVTGRGELVDLAGFRPELVVGALEAMDTEVLEQLEVPDVAETRAAVREMVAQFRRDQEAAAAQQQQEQRQPEQQGEGAAGASNSGREQQQAAGRAGGRPSAQADKEAEAEKGGAVAEPLPGFGPAKSGAPGAGGSRGSGGGGPSGSR